MNKRTKYILLSLLSGLLLFAGWPPRILFPLLFTGMVPLFYLQKLMDEDHKKGFIWYAYLSMLVWNLLTTWWVGYASVGGAIAMLLANSALMIIPFSLFRFTKRTLGESKALIFFILFWLSFEYIHLTWEISYPWLTLGNGLAAAGKWIQWYEYTGILGGSLWILVLNILIYRAFTSTKLKVTYSAALAFAIPVILSFGMYYNYEPKPGTTEVLVIQPNIDPYNKFNAGQEINQVQLFLELAEKNISPETKLILLPETAIVEYMDEGQINQYSSLRLLRDFIKKHKSVQILTGASTYRFYMDGEEPSRTARKTEDGGYYDSYNTAILIDSNGVTDYYHKSKLVPGVEKMPYPAIFGFLEYFSIDMGGISGSLGQSDEPVVFKTQGLNIIPAICYESVYGGYLGKFVLKGANLIGVITNDGWWEDTDGYKQHMLYGRLRAIEFRMPLIRSANTGISCSINGRGDISNRTSWWRSETFKVKVSPENRVTFYAKSGDYLGKIATWLSVFLIISMLVKNKINKK